MHFGLGVLGHPPDVFWNMTPSEIEAAYAGYHARQHEERLLADYRAGQLAVLLIEPHRDRQKRPQPFAPDDFFPSLTEILDKRGPTGTPTRGHRQQTPEE